MLYKSTQTLLRYSCTSPFVAHGAETQRDTATTALEDFRTHQTPKHRHQSKTDETVSSALFDNILAASSSFLPTSPTGGSDAITSSLGFRTTSFLPPYACEVPSHCGTQARCTTTPHLRQQPVATPQLEALAQRTVHTIVHGVQRPPPGPRKGLR